MRVSGKVMREGRKGRGRHIITRRDKLIERERAEEIQKESKNIENGGLC